MSKLCSVCSQVNPTVLSSRGDLDGGIIQYGYAHYPSFNKLLTSAATCSLCALIAATIGKKGQMVTADEDVINDPSTIRLVGFPLPVLDSDGKVIPAKISSILAGNAYLRGWLSIYSFDSDPSASSIDGRQIGLAPDSTQTMDIARFWLHDCVANHTACRRLISGKSINDSQPIMPRYVVDVGEAGKRPKLLKVTPGMRDPYVALSHIWGNGSYTTQTTSKNVLRMQQAIDLNAKESKTLSDAVTITRALGYAYLWVDSLCIVQDGPGFDAECALMGQVFENAIVTIAATGAANDHVGCIIPRTTQKIAPVKFVTKFANGTASHIYIGPQVGRLENTVDQGIWASRGWLLQERVLSRRTIYYAGDQLYWQCDTCTRSEDGVLIQQGNPKRLFYGTLGSTDVADKNAQDALCFSRWCQLVAEYTTRSLTRPEDTLNALSGVATEIVNRTGATYLAGHWRRYLQIGLLWQAKSIRLQSPATPRAPSWSWASRIGPTFHDLYIYEAVRDDHYKIVSEDVTAQKEDVHGKTFSGSIELAGKMKPATKMQGGIHSDILWDRVSTSIHGYSQERELLSILVQDDGTPVGWGSFDTVDDSHHDTDTRLVSALCVSKNMPPAPVETSTTLNPVDGEAPTVATPTYNVLLLQPADEEGKTYKRVGMGEITTDLWFDDVGTAASVTLV